MTGSTTITQLLERWSDGDRAAAERLIPLVYEELRQLARRRFLGERRDHTLQPTALVHEVFLRLSEADPVRWQNRSHFFGIAAHLMRRVLVDHSRERRRAKRGGGRGRVALDETAELPAPERGVDLLALDDALEALAAADPRKASIVELRYFGGLTFDEIAACLGLSAKTVSRDWRKARAALYLELAVEDAGGG